MISRTVILILMMITVFSTDSEAATDENTLHVRASTLGLGIEASHSFDSMRLRIGGHFFGFKTNQTIGEIDYEIDVKLRYASFLLDWHPNDGRLFFSGGLLYNADEITARSHEATTYLIGGHHFPMGDTGRITALVEYPALAPYLGIGWDGQLSKSGHLTWMAEIGVGYMGKSTVTMATEHQPTGLPGSDQWEKDLSQEALVLEDYFDQFQLFPVISLGLGYCF